MKEGATSPVLRARALEYLTLGWNACEAVVAIVSGMVAGSTALLGFGIDSLIESASGAAVLWRFWGDGRGEGREEVALRLVGASFLLLAGWVAWEAVSGLVAHEVPERSPVGIALAAASLVVMPLLARAKRKVAAEVGSRALAADSRQTDLCAYLSAVLLIGLFLNAVVGLWWADPVAALVMSPIIGREGLQALKGEACGDCHLDLHPSR